MGDSGLDRKICWNLPVRFMDIWYRLPEGDTVLCVAERKVMAMENLLDELEQGIEMRVDRLCKEWEQRKKEPGQKSGRKKGTEISDRVNQIIMGLPESDGRFLDELLSDRDIMTEEERMWFYRSGLADALDILRYLRR